MRKYKFKKSGKVIEEKYFSTYEEAEEYGFCNSIDELIIVLK